MADHALLSASGAHRWLECTPSAKLEQQFPPSTSEYAEEGTAAHELAELTARYFLGEISEADYETRRDELAKGPSKRQAGRLVMTETAAFANEARKDCFKDLGVEKYVIVETLDGDTCSLCGQLNGKVYPMSEYAVGVTAPPFHPWCRGTTAPWFDDLQGLGVRAARDEQGKYYEVPREMTYSQWAKKSGVSTENGKGPFTSEPGRGIIEIGRSLGAKAANYDVMDLDTGEMFTFAEGTKIQDVQVFAGKGSRVVYRRAAKYADLYGGKPEDWQHVKGFGVLSTPDGDREAEVHWSQCEGIGNFDFFL